MSVIGEALELNFIAIAVGVLLIAFAAKEIIEIVTYYKTKFGIHTKFTDKDIELEERIATLEEIASNREQEISQILECVQKLEQGSINKAIEDDRFQILDMASAISSGRQYTDEQLRHIFRVHDRYNKLLEENGMSNGYVDASMKIIENAAAQRNIIIDTPLQVKTK